MKFTTVVLALCISFAVATDNDNRNLRRKPPGGGGRGPQGAGGPPGQLCKGAGLSEDNCMAVSSRLEDLGVGCCVFDDKCRGCEE